jgi:hypothetical protein
MTIERKGRPKDGVIEVYLPGRGASARLHESVVRDELPVPHHVQAGILHDVAVAVEREASCRPFVVVDPHERILELRGIPRVCPGCRCRQQIHGVVGMRGVDVGSAEYRATNAWTNARTAAESASDRSSAAGRQVLGCRSGPTYEVGSRRRRAEHDRRSFDSRKRKSTVARSPM